VVSRNVRKSENRMSTSATNPSSSRSKQGMSRELKSATKKPGLVGGVLQERTSSQINKKNPFAGVAPGSKKNDPKQQSIFGFKGFAQIGKDSSKSFDIFNDENKGTAATVEGRTSTPTSSGKTKSGAVHQQSQTDITGDYASVVGDGDLAFYKELAERRREALNDSLAENESLVNENSILKYENSELNKTNQSLQESVNKASRLAEMLEEAGLLDNDSEETPVEADGDDHESANEDGSEATEEHTTEKVISDSADEVSKKVDGDHEDKSSPAKERDVKQDGTSSEKEAEEEKGTPGKEVKQ